MNRPEVGFLKAKNGEPIFGEPWHAQTLALADLKRAWGDPLGLAMIDAWFFGEAARGFARLMAPRSPAWLYRFDYVADRDRSIRKLANHASDIAYVFGNLPATASSASRARTRDSKSTWA